MSAESLNSTKSEVTTEDDGAVEVESTKDTAETLYGASDEKPSEKEAKTEEEDSDVEDSEDEGDSEDDSEEGKDSKEAKEGKDSKDDFSLEAPEGSLLDPSMVKKTASWAMEQGLDKDQAQAVLERESAAVANHLESQKEELKTKVDKTWVEEAKYDKEIGGEKWDETVELSKRAVEKFASPKLVSILEETGFGNHPELVRVFSRIGRVMSDSKLIEGRVPSVKEKSTADIFYGGSDKSKDAS